MGMASLEDLAEMMPYMNHYVMKSERLDDRYLGEGSISIAEIIYAEKMKSRAQWYRISFLEELVHVYGMVVAYSTSCATRMEVKNPPA